MPNNYPIILFQLGSEGETLTICGRTDNDPRVQKPAVTYYLDDDDIVSIPAEEFADFSVCWRILTSRYRNWYCFYPVVVHELTKPAIARSVERLKTKRAKTSHRRRNPAPFIARWEAALAGQSIW